MSVTPFKMSGRMKSEADNYKVNPFYVLMYDKPLVSTSNPPMVADQSSYNRTNVAASNSHDRTGQKSLAQINEYAVGMERTSQISNDHHSNRNNEEKEDTVEDEMENEVVEEEEVVDNIQDTEENLATSIQLDMFITKDQMHVESSKNEEKEDTVEDEVVNEEVVEEEEVVDNIQDTEENLATSIQLDMFITKDQMHVENRNNEEKEDTVEDEEENEEAVEEEKVVDNIKDTEENLATCKHLDMFTTKDQMHVENYMTSDEGYFACTQIPTNKGQDSMDSDVTKVFETLIVDKSIDFASRIGNKDEIDRYTLEKNVKNGVKAKEEVAEHCQENWKIWVTYKKLGIFQTKNQIQDEGGQATRLIPKQMSSVLSDDWINILPDEVKRKFINRSKSIHPEDSLANLKLLVDITTSSDETGEELKECRRDNESVYSRQERNYAVIGLDILCSGHQMFWMKKQDNVTPLKLLHEFTNLLGKTGEEPKEFKNTMAGVRCNIKSTRIKLYQNVIRNETCRMMTSINMVVSEANHLFGHERTRIFFDLLDELFYDGSAGAISDFVPNMAESDVRQHVISFFEYACDMMNRLLTLLLSYPDSKRLQKMPEKKFISLMKSVIVSSSRKTETKGEKPSSKVTKGIKLIMVDSKDFERAVGEDISEDVSERLRRGDKMIVHRIVDTRLEKPQTSDRRDKKPIHSIYFPSDCRLFIYIPTENGSYWHQSDMRRASRIHGYVEQF